MAKAIRATISGRPGVAYIDMPGDLLRKSAIEVEIPKEIIVPRPPITRPLESDVKKAVELLSRAQRPLVIIGKGAAFSRNADSPIKAFVEQTNLPFLATPMGKGCLPDDDPRSVGSAR